MNVGQANGKQKKPNIACFILSILTGLMTLYAMELFAFTLSDKKNGSPLISVIFAVIMILLGVGTFFLGRPYYSRLNNKTRKPNIFCFVCSIISTLSIAFFAWVASVIFSRSSAPGEKATTIVWVLWAIIITVFFGYFFYPRLSRKKRSIAFKIYGCIIGVFVAGLIFFIVFKSLNTVSIGDKNFDTKESSVRLSLDIVNKNDLAKLKDMKNLEELTISGCFMDDDDVKLIGELTQLKKLSLALNTDVTDVSPLNSLKDLTSLNIFKTNVRDISCLKDLTNLETLNISGTKVVDVSVIGSYTSLKYLYMNSLSALNPKTIKLPESLTMLECSDDGIEDIGFIGDLKALSSIVAKNNNISDISAVERLEKIYTVDFTGNSISDISVLKGLKPHYVKFSHNKISDISALTGNSELFDVDLSYNQITDISPLKDCFEIYALNLSHNQITDISALKDCFRIGTLNLSHNQIKDITAIATIDKLKNLNLRANQIVDISPLGQAEELVNATRLDLRDNKISSVKALASFKQLKDLYLSNNNITDISPLASCEEITTLSLNGNKISDISPLAKLTKLNSLEIVGNPISDLSALSMNSRSGVLGDSDFAYAYLSVSYNDSINWEALKNTKKLIVLIYDTPERQKDKLKDLGFLRFRKSSELDKDEDDSNG